MFACDFSGFLYSISLYCELPTAGFSPAAGFILWNQKIRATERDLRLTNPDTHHRHGLLEDSLFLKWIRENKNLSYSHLPVDINYHTHWLYTNAYMTAYLMEMFLLTCKFSWNCPLLIFDGFTKRTWCCIFPHFPCEWLLYFWLKEKIHGLKVQKNNSGSLKTTCLDCHLWLLSLYLICT